MGVEVNLPRMRNNFVTWGGAKNKMAYGGYTTEYNSQYGQTSSMNTPYKYSTNEAPPYDYGRSSGGNYDRGYGELPSKRRKLTVTDLTVCVDYLRAVCDRGPRCNKAHVSHINDPDERHTLSQNKFCHDFQNRGQCARGTCKFLHVTKREEDEFLMTGLLPQAVLDRARDQQQVLNSSYNRYEDNMPPPRQPPSSHGGFGGGRGGPGGGGRSDGRGGGSDFHSGYGSWNESGRGGGSGWGGNRQGGGGDRRPNKPIPNRIDEDICRDFVRGCCNRGDTCKFLHITPEDKKRSQTGSTPSEADRKLQEENERLRKRVRELEQLLADACQCITAFGEQNPAVQAIVQSITADIPDKSLSASGDVEQTADQGAAANCP